MDSVPTGCGTGRLLKLRLLARDIFQAKHTALASDILRGYVNQARFKRQKNGANASGYEVQNTPSHVGISVSGTD